MVEYTLACTTRECVRVGVRQHMHARANLRSNARISQSRIADFSHTLLLRHGSLFCSPPRSRLCHVLIPTIARFILFSLLHFSLSLFLFVFLGQPLCNHGSPCTTLWYISRRLTRDWKLSCRIMRPVSTIRSQK